MPDQPFNACEYLLDRRMAAGDGDRLAITGVAGDLSYAALLERVHRIAGVLRDLGLQPEQRLALFMADCPDFIATYLAVMRIGAVAVPVSTMLRPDGLAGLLRDSRARLLAVTPEFAPVAREAIGGAPELCGVLAAGGAVIAPGAGPAVHDLDALAAAAPAGPGAGVPDHRGLARVLALHLRDDGGAQGGHAPSRLGPRGLRGLRRAGARHPPG